MAEKISEGVLKEKEGRKIVQEFQELTDHYRMEYSDDLPALFNEFGYLLICRLSGMGYFDTVWNQYDADGDNTEDLGGKVNFSVFTSDQIRHYVEELKQSLWKTKEKNSRLQEFWIHLVEKLRFSISTQKPFILRQMLIIIDDLSRLWPQYRDKEVMESTILQCHTLCLNTKNDRNRFVLPEQMTCLIQQLLREQRTQNVESLMDPQCGSGSMLIAAKKHLKNDSGEDISLYGFEINERLRVSALILGILTDTQMEISDEDFLQKQTDGKPDASQHQNADRKYDIVLSNPSFTNENMQKPTQFSNLSVPIRGRHNLFVVQSIRALNVQGQAAVIVPDSFLFSTRRETREVRKWILEKYQLEAVLSLPPNIFRTNTSVNTSVLFIRLPFMESGWAEGTQYVLFYQLMEKEGQGQTEGTYEQVFKVWNQKERLFNKWMHNSRDWQENFNNVLTPTDWKPKEYWFTDIKTIRESGWNLLPGHYQPAVRQELKFEDPEILLGKLIGEQEELLKSMHELMEEIYEL